MRLSGKAGTRAFWLVVAAFSALVPVSAEAHTLGSVAAEPTWRTLITGWQFDPIFIVIIGLSSWFYLDRVRTVNRAHPNSPFPRKRVVYFFSAMGVLVLAVMSPIGAYDNTLFFIHMLQHMLIIMIAAPLFLLSTPITLVLRAASGETRRRVLIPILHSGVVRFITYPVFTFTFFSATLIATHFSPLYNLALTNNWVHEFEHTWYLLASLLFWWPLMVTEPVPFRMNHFFRLGYVFLQMPLHTFIGLSFYDSTHAFYNQYAVLSRSWGPSPLIDQQLAGIVMWVFGDMMYVGALILIAWDWSRYEDRAAVRGDRARERERAQAAPGTSGEVARS